MFTTRIDIPEQTRRTIVSICNQQLADTFDLYSQIKQAHWNVKGLQFIALHQLFDTLAEPFDDWTDNIAERITALGGTATGTVRCAASMSRIPEYPLVTEGSDHVVALATRYAILARSTRLAADQAIAISDVTTADMFTEISRELDKHLWFLEAHLQF